MKAEAWVQKNVMFLPISEHFYRTTPFFFCLKFPFLETFQHFSSSAFLTLATYQSTATWMRFLT